MVQYYKLSGQLVNFHKSKIQFSKEYTIQLRKKLQKFSKSLEATVLASPWDVIGQRRNKTNFRRAKRLARWKTRILWNVGKAILTKSNLRYIPQCSMKLLKWPNVYVMSINRNITGIITKLKVVLTNVPSIAWKEICRHGGCQGFRKTEE